MEEIKMYLNQRLEQLEKMRQECKKFLANAPEGKLYINNNKNTNQYLYRIKGNPKKVYIRKNNMELIKALAQKEYEEKVLKVLEDQIDCIQRFNLKYNDNAIIEVYQYMKEEKKNFVLPFELDEDTYANQWKEKNIRIKEKLKYKIKNKYDLDNIEESRRIFTERGEQVRSKSEKILADKLNMMNIPYVYELPVYIKDYGYINPDFFVLNRRIRKEYYWEHLGMMDNGEYSKSAICKINRMSKNGIIVGKNLILTFETSDQPINTQSIECLINENLL